MKRFLIGVCLALSAFAAQALQPYVASDTKVGGGDLKGAMVAAEQKLAAGGLQVVGRHTPKGLPNHGSLVVTDSELTETLKKMGGLAVVGIPIRVGVKSDGTVSYLNMEYWGRAFIRKDFGKVEGAYKAAAGKLEKALGAGQPFGGDVKAEDLPSYRYMFGMGRFDDDIELKSYPSFDEALKQVQANLAKGANSSAKVYELVYADKKMAVFGVAHNDTEKGEGWWVNKIGPDHVAALPWEIFINDGHVYALRGRYRTALSWPSLTMGQFMTISNHPDNVLEVMKDLAGVQ
ncbi:MAG: hypothetical protein HY777_13780 [Betaproteobacteria bacterium]|nr:hypothetical protein [Betaproteobacteria bacterium]